MRKGPWASPLNEDSTVSRIKIYKIKIILDKSYRNILTWLNRLASEKFPTPLLMNGDSTVNRIENHKIKIKLN